MHLASKICSMGIHTLILILALGLGFAFPSLASVIRVECMLGAYFPDSDDCSRYYQCVDDGRIRAFTCPDGTYFCGEEEQCCSKPIDSEDNCNTLRTYKSSQTNDEIENVEQSRFGSELVDHTENVKIDEDDRSLDFVGQRFQFMTRNDGVESKPDDEYTLHDSIEKEPSSLEDFEKETTTSMRGEFNFASDDEPINDNNDDEPSNEEPVINQNSDNPFLENEEEGVGDIETHDTTIDSESVADSVEDNISKELPEDPEINESNESSYIVTHREKRNDDETELEGTSDEQLDEGSKKKNKTNQDDDEIEASTVISSVESSTDDDNDQTITTPDTSKTEETESNEDNVDLNPEFDNDNSKPEIVETPFSDNPTSINARGSIAHSHSMLDHKAHQLVQIVKSLIRLAEETPYPVHRELLSPDSDVHLQTSTTLAP